MECPVCEGAGVREGDVCGHCKGGSIEITSCPHRLVTRPVADLAMMERLMESGLPPVAGGSLDQPASFLTAAARLKRERERAISERRRRE